MFVNTQINIFKQKILNEINKLSCLCIWSLNDTENFNIKQWSTQKNIYIYKYIYIKCKNKIKIDCVNLRIFAMYILKIIKKS